MAEVEVAKAGAGGVDAEARLVAGLRQGDPGACAELYDRYARRVHKFLAWRLEGDAHTAEELMVQTLAEAVRTLSSYDPRRGRLLVWLFGIATRHAQAEWRLRRRRKHVPQSAQVALTSVAEHDLVADPTGALAARLEAQRQVALLQTVLSPHELEALWLYGAHGFTAGEVGQVLGKSERAIRSLLHRATQKARERLVNDARTD